MMLLQSSPSSSSLQPQTLQLGSSSSPLSVCKFDDDSNMNTNHQGSDQEGPDALYATTTT